MKRIALFAAAALLLVGCKQKQETPEPVQEPQGSVVYMTKEISPEALINVYKALGVPAEGRVAVKISTGEAGNNNHLIFLNQSDDVILFPAYRKSNRGPCLRTAELRESGHDPAPQKFMIR